jgi:glycosyltransferase involved in cell wall biosynthesis
MNVAMNVGWTNLVPALPHSAWLLLALGCAFGPVLTFAINLAFFRKPSRSSAGTLPAVSVLIPARNEEASIFAAVLSVLASEGVTLELLVLDDASTDRTAELVEQFAKHDERVVLHRAPQLPAGWNGKQHACQILSTRAQHAYLCFLDADVRLAPNALAVLLARMQAHPCSLLSGFPLEETGTWLEKLLIPLIHFVLLCYLPLPLLRAFPRVPALAAGCGQLLLVRKSAYQSSGGHAAIRQTMHDGILLPGLFRQNGFATDLVDITDLARCRMYRNAGEVWRGLGKNATEGMAAPARIVPFTIMLFFGQVMPAAWLVVAWVTHSNAVWPGLAVLAGYLVRFVALLRFRQSLLGALLHPIAIGMLLVLQWWALARKLAGRQAVWKQRAYDVG